MEVHVAAPKLKATAILNGDVPPNCFAFLSDASASAKHCKNRTSAKTQQPAASRGGAKNPAGIIGSLRSPIHQISTPRRPLPLRELAPGATAGVPMAITVEANAT